MDWADLFATEDVKTNNGGGIMGRDHHGGERPYVSEIYCPKRSDLNKELLFQIYNQFSQQTY